MSCDLGEPNQSCPLCRGALGETDQVQEMELAVDLYDYDIRQTILTGVAQQGWSRIFAVPFQHPGRVARLLGDDRRAEWDPSSPETRWRRILHERLQERYASRPLEQTTHEVPDPVDVRFVAEYGCLSLDTARAYLAYHANDPLETALFLLREHRDRPIPRFKARDRPAVDEPYVSRNTRDRVETSVLKMDSPHDGYESC
jgi:hypothetical protein